MFGSFDIDVVESASLFGSQVLQVVASEAGVPSVLGHLFLAEVWLLGQQFFLVVGCCLVASSSFKRRSGSVWVRCGFEDVLVVHAAGEEVDEGLGVLRQGHCLAVDLFGLLLWFLSLLEEDIEKSEGHDDEANHELQNVEGQVLLLLHNQVIVDGQWIFGATQVTFNIEVKVNRMQVSWLHDFI